jgi:hypothetical protein
MKKLLTQYTVPAHGRSSTHYTVNDVPRLVTSSGKKEGAWSRCRTGPPALLHHSPDDSATKA